MSDSPVPSGRGLLNPTRVLLTVYPNRGNTAFHSTQHFFGFLKSSHSTDLASPLLSNRENGPDFSSDSAIPSCTLLHGSSAANRSEPHRITLQRNYRQGVFFWIEPSKPNSRTAPTRLKRQTSLTRWQKTMRPNLLLNG